MFEMSSISKEMSMFWFFGKDHENHKNLPKLFKWINKTLVMGQLSYSVLFVVIIYLKCQSHFR